MSGPRMGSGVGQLALLEVNDGDRLPAGHLVWDVLERVGELDLSAFKAGWRADRRGRAGYDPTMLLTLILYGRSKKLVSGRQLAAACYDDLGARVITGNQYPDRSVLDRFLNSHAAAVQQLLVQTLSLGARDGLVDVAVVAGDGTKIRANASTSANVSEPDLRTQIGDLQTQIAGLRVRWSQQVSSEQSSGQSRRQSSGSGHGYGTYLFDDTRFTAAAARPDLTGTDLTGTHLTGTHLVDADPDDAGPDDAGTDDGGTDDGGTDDGGTDDGGTDDGGGGGQGNAEKTWREIGRLTSILHARQRALGHLQTHPGSALSDWADKVTMHERHLARADEKLQETRVELQAAADRRAATEAAGKKVPGTRPVPVEDHNRMRRLREARTATLTRLETTRAARPTTTINTTDPGSRIMPGKHGGFAQNYNLQAVACKNQFILGIGLHDSPNDKQALIALLQTARTNLDAAGITQPIQVALFDNGYASDANFTADLPVDTLLIAVTNERNQNRKTPTTTETSTTTTQNSHTHSHTHSQATAGSSAAGSGSGAGGRKIGGSTPAWHLMDQRLTDPTNRTLYKRRSTIIEPLFAQLFTRFGRTLNLRGNDVLTELHLWAVTHNLLKISSHRRKARPPG